MTREMDAYRYSDEDSPRNRRANKACGKRAVTLISALFIVAVIIVVAVVLAKDGDSNDTASDKTQASAATNGTSTDAAGSGSSTGTTTTPPSSSGCPAIAPHERTVAFWQSEVDGCEKIPSGVTHVVFGFALVSNATQQVLPTFQNTDDEIKACVKSLKTKCIVPMGSIGGSTNNAELAATVDADAFATSAVKLIDKFGFQGLDLDDETVGAEFNATRVIARVRALRTALEKKDKSLLLTYDAYFNEGEPSFCKNPEYSAYTRCFPTEIIPSVDWINIMAYNVQSDPTAAAEIYDKALNTTFAEWATQLDGDFTRATIGVCVEKSCAYGPGPSTAIVERWNKFARQAGVGGGMMVYAASGEVADDFAVTRSVLPVSTGTT
ncbi:hypothetical protein Poli38472_014102 [Pythium oligandrum]|uniref:GH18 domain-containing protein n=1 Tax=Pythium oligandrum TaxID=41045 RepID=A0A8K1CNW0_PYTOL|nr:hypothetical protein Poli38472_014102 [Pythium oligandrum]|eukprot:TMW66790.1 hypothetical protein Poli38472_014102 [Pythium oligandrum]